MALLKIWEVSRGIMRLLAIQFVCWLGCFSTFALAQFDISEGVTGSVNFPALGVTCVANLAVFVTSLIRGRLDLEMGARDVLEILLSPKLQNIKRIKHGYGLTTCRQGNATSNTTTGGGGAVGVASSEGVPQAASTGENDVQTASTEENVQSSPTEGGGLQTISTEERVLHIGSTEGHVGSTDVQTASMGGGRETASTAENVLGSPRERRGLQTILTVEDEEEKGLMLSSGTADWAMRQFIESNARVGGGDVGVASSEGVLQAASTGENDVQTASTEERALHIGPTEGQVSSREQENEENGLKTAGVIILSNDRPNWSMRQFIKSNAHVVDSIILQFLPLQRARYDAKVSEELTARVTIAECESRNHQCNCIVFWTVKQITSMLARRMPGTLKALTDSLCLLPCSTCLRKGCHECNRENLLRADSEADEGQPMKQRVVSDFLHKIPNRYIRGGTPIGICIPMNDVHGDDWTKLLLKSLRSKDAEGRGVTNKAAEALEGYLGGGRGSEEETVEYDIFSFLVPRLTEVLINLVLTLWFRVDGFSSALLARRTVRDYLVDNKSSGFAANAFLTKAEVKVTSNGDNSQVCQVLTFRGCDWLCFITFISVGCVNVICALGWSLLISFEGGPDTSQPPSLPTVAVIIAAIGSPWVVLTTGWMTAWLVTEGVMRVLRRPVKAFLRQCKNITTEGITIAVSRPFPPKRGRIKVQFLLKTGRWFVRVFVLVFLILASVVISPVILPGCLLAIMLKDRHRNPYASPLIATGILFEMACLLSWSALAGALGIKVFGRWLYAALQILIWVKWAMGSYFLNWDNSSEFFGRNPHRVFLIVYSSAFWLNAVLAGVRCKWEAWPWKHDHLF